MIAAARAGSVGKRRSTKLRADGHERLAE
jgi:hypothetical protein